MMSLKEEAGPHYWYVLHNIANQFPNNPSQQDKEQTQSLIMGNISNFVCKECIQHAYDFISKNPINLDNRSSLRRWMCELHNNANVHAGKSTKDCSNLDDKEGECKECSLAPSFSKYMNWRDRYPSRKRAFMVNEEVNNNKPATSINELSQKYPSLAGLPGLVGEGNEQQPKEEEMDGILKPLDSIYQLPAQVVDIKPYQFNLAYTPEMITNTLSLISQMYLTNFGSLLTTVVGSLGLFGVSVFAKNSLSTYDRLFVQNVVASMLFHSLNFINPRIRDDVLPHAHRFVEGVTSMDIDKIKSALLYEHEEEKSPDELLAMINGPSGKLGRHQMIDMDRLKVPKSSYMSGAGQGSGSSLRDLRSGIGAGSSSLIKDYTNPLKGSNPPNYGILGAMESEYSYILDNELL